MAIIRNFVFLLVAVLLLDLPVDAQSGPSGLLSLEAIAERLDQLERQNTELREQIQLLQAELQTAKSGAEAVEFRAYRDRHGSNFKVKPRLGGL